MKLKIESMYFTYLNQASPVLNDISISFEKNKIYLLLGPSGCGKSSFVNILAGIIPNNIMGEIKGNITIDGDCIIGKESYEIANSYNLYATNAVARRMRKSVMATSIAK